MNNLDAEGLHLDRPNAISTWTGRRVEPLNMRVEDVDIADIAHALARLCRYNGHVENYYSVARHSIFVSEALDGTGHELAGLLHDAAEAYLGDLVRPLKQADELAAFRAADTRLDSIIAVAARLPFPQAPEVAEADRRLLIERELPADGLRYTWNSTPEEDERDFLARYRQLTGVTVGAGRRDPLLIGLSGYARSGKDTAARILTEFFSFKRLAFADIMREVLLATDPLIPTDLLDIGSGKVQRYDRLSALIVGDEYNTSIGWDRAKTEYPEVRALLQRLGTEGGRNILGENVWVDATMAKVEGRTVFTDVRFPNEYDAIKAAGGQVWRINRPGTSAVNMHPSETALDTHTFDRVVHNDKGIAEFDRAVHQAAAALFLKR